MEKAQSDFMAYGIDSASAKKLSQLYTVRQLKKQTVESLNSLGISQETAELLSHPARTPRCYHVHGAGIGWGTGQLYLRENNRWLLVAGFCDCEENSCEAEAAEELLLQFLEDLK